MRWYSVVAIYFIVWWTVLFVVLPFGVRQPDEGERIAGTDPGAPARPMLLRKAVAATLVSGVLVGGFYVAYVHYGLTVEGLARRFGVAPVPR